MKQIKTIIKDIKEEISGATHYAKLATQYKDTDKALADAYYSMANQELAHVDLLHAQAVRMIKAYQATGKEVPSAMQAVWDFEHEMRVDDLAKVKTLLSMYKG